MSRFLDGVTANATVSIHYSLLPLVALQFDFLCHMFDIVERTTSLIETDHHWQHPIGYSLPIGTLSNQFEAIHDLGLCVHEL